MHCLFLQCVLVSEHVPTTDSILSPPQVVIQDLSRYIDLDDAQVPVVEQTRTAMSDHLLFAIASPLSQVCHRVGQTLYGKDGMEYCIQTVTAKDLMNAHFLSNLIEQSHRCCRVFWYFKWTYMYCVAQFSELFG